MALRRPMFHRVLDYEDEFFAFLMLILETHSLRTTGGTLLPPSIIFACFPLIFIFNIIAFLEYI